MDLHALTDARCLDEQRKAAVREHPTLNGIDFVETDGASIVVTFLKSPAPADLVGHPERVTILGGARIVGIRATAVLPLLELDRLRIELTEPGDFSTYWLTLDSAGLDPQLAAAPFRFRADCPTEFDCRQEPECPPEVLAEPVLDYLAKDYASFRRLLLDLIPQRNPRWLERNPADLGMALVELLAYAGDQLSYFQDAVATEAYLDTVRHRVSAKRHGRLVDYRMHDGRNAWGFVQLDVGNPGIVPQETMLLTRIARPLKGKIAPPATVIPSADLDFEADPVLRGVVVFETTAPGKTDPRNNRLWLHTWGNRDCCTPRGATGAYLYGVSPGTDQAIRPPLTPGDYLLLEEVKGPVTGLAADPDPAHRQVVRLVSVEEVEDPLYSDQLAGGELQPVTDPVQAPLPLLKVTWREKDALTFPLCLSTHHPETGPIGHISIARGNVIPCDHGRTVKETLPPPAPSGGRAGLLEAKLSQGPLTFHAMPPTPTFDAQGALQEARHDLNASPRDVQPALVLLMSFPPAEIEIWTPVPHLLDSHPFDRHFVVDVGNNGRATLRFGDDEYGRSPVGADGATARYRIGNGGAGSLGSGSLVHIVSPVSLTEWPDVTEVRQPLAARGGADPESIEEVRQLAPRAFHAEQFRAMTESDYEAAALKLRAVAAAKCTFRWTGSWLTVFVGIHPRNPADLITEPGGRTRLAEGLARAARAHLTRYKLAGYDLEVRTAQYVPLEIEIQVCVARGHFRGDVLEAVYRALSTRQFVDGSTGFFHLSRFAFGQAVYLSRLYAAVEDVEGVESAVVTVFKRYWMMANEELENGVIPMGPWEIARLDNDPNFQENGVLRLSAVGGL